MLFVGIDCGKEGATFAINEARKVLLVRDQPLDENDQLDYDAMGAIFDALLGLDKYIDVSIEEVRAMPHAIKGRPVAHDTNSSFKLGCSYGAWRRELASRGIKPHLYPPTKWKPMMLAGLPKGKLSSVEQAERVFPTAAYLFRGPKGGLYHDRAEAALLAELGRKMWRLTGR